MLGGFGLLALAMSVAPTQGVTDFDRFRLFNNCEPMGLVVAVPDDDEDVKKFGLAEERVQFAVESRLRGARLFSSDLGSSALEVDVSVAGGAFKISMFYNKLLLDSVSGENNFAATWIRWVFGTHGQKPNYIISSLPELIDEFIAEYLRVNESACTGSPQPPPQ